MEKPEYKEANSILQILGTFQTERGKLAFLDYMCGIRHKNVQTIARAIANGNLEDKAADA